jgi:predicted esterase
MNVNDLPKQQASPAFTRGGRGQKQCDFSGLSYYENQPAAGPANEIVILIHGKEHFGRFMMRRAVEDIRTLNPRALILAPNAPLTSHLEIGGTGTRIRQRSKTRPTRSQHCEWFRIPSVRDALSAVAQLRASIAPVLDQMHQFVSARLAEHHFDESRLTLVGFSQGGAIATHVGIEREKPCRGVYNLCGIFFDPTGVLQRGEPQSRPPIFFGFTKGDEVVPNDLFGHALYAMRKHQLPVTTHITQSYPVIRHETPKPPYIFRSRFTLKPPFLRLVREKAIPVPVLYQQPSFLQFSPTRNAHAPHMTAHIVHPQMLQAAIMHRQGLCDPALGMVSINDRALGKLSSPLASLASLAISRAMTVALHTTTPASVFGQLVRDIRHGYLRLCHLNYHFNRLVSRNPAVVAVQQVISQEWQDQPEPALRPAAINRPVSPR